MSEMIDPSAPAIDSKSAEDIVRDLDPGLVDLLDDMEKALIESEGEENIEPWRDNQPDKLDMKWLNLFKAYGDRRASAAVTEFIKDNL